MLYKKDVLKNLATFSFVRAGKIRFSGERNSMLLKASSGACCAPRNFVLLVMLRGTSVCLTVYLTMHQMK